MTVVHGPRDFGIADLSRGFGFTALSHSSIADPAYFRYYFLEPLVYLMQASQHFVFIHASCIARNRNAVVLCGDSGSGKTCLAYACAKRGWNFVTGDALHLVRAARNHTVIGRPFELRFRESARRLFPELNSTPGEARPNGKVDIAVTPSGLGLDTELSAIARAIVFLDRSAPSGLHSYAPEAALQQLGQTICFGDEESRQAQWETLKRFVALPLRSLNVSDLDEAERLLAELPGLERTC